MGTPKDVLALQAKNALLRRPSLRSNNDLLSALITGYPQLSKGAREQIIREVQEARQPVHPTNGSKTTPSNKDLRDLLTILCVWYPQLKPKLAFDALGLACTFDSFQGMMGQIKTNYGSDLVAAVLEPADIVLARPYMLLIKRLAEERQHLNIPEVPPLPETVAASTSPAPKQASAPAIEQPLAATIPQTVTPSTRPVIVPDKVSEMELPRPTNGKATQVLATVASNGSPRKHGPMARSEREQMTTNIKNLLCENPEVSTRHAFLKIRPSCTRPTFDGYFQLQLDALRQKTSSASTEVFMDAGTSEAPTIPSAPAIQEVPAAEAVAETTEEKAPLPTSKAVKTMSASCAKGSYTITQQESGAWHAAINFTGITQDEAAKLHSFLSRIVARE